MTKDELLRQIKTAKEENWTTLNLSFENVSELPSEIIQLTNLQLLSLNGNQLSALPSEISQLTNLETLSLDENQLSELPSEIIQLTNLQLLSLNGNQLSALPSEISQLTNLETLSLDENQLSELPSEIIQLTNLSTLSLDENQLSALPSEISQLTNLSTLFLSRNQLSALPSEISQLTNLSTLSLDENQLSELPSEISQLTNLSTLYLNGNQLSELPSEIIQLTNLSALYLDGNQLSELPSEISQLTNLQLLSLNGNQLSELPSEISQLTNLQLLSLNGNQLSALPSEIIQLTNLSTLSLDENQLSALPSEISQLTNLSTLFLSRNQLSELPSEIIQLTNLSRLSLDGNQLSELPNEISQLTNLQTLYLDETQFKQFTVDLLNIKKVNLVIDGVRISQEVLSRISSSEELIDNYLLLKGDSRELNEAKVLVVGQGSVGKTSLIKRLITGNYNPKENKTDGIDIYKEWKVRCNDREVQLNVWDFGGQEIMHATHQFFLTKRSLYILVLDSRIEKEENRVEYWLEKIKSLGGNSPVLVVGNKIDQNQMNINQKGLSDKYRNIKGFYPVSCETNKNIGRLKEDLIKEIGVLNGIHDVLPESWFRVKEELEKIDKDHIPFDDYIKVCKQIGVDEEYHGKLIRLLHDLGIVLNFRDDDRLNDTNVLNPEWITQGVYKIINSKELFKSKGLLKRTSISNILDTRKYPKTKQMFIIKMMRKFELCFDIEEDKTFLVPDLLEENELDTGDWTDSLKFQYHYKVLFNSIITRFIVKMHKNISKDTYWRTGVVLLYKDGDKILNRALVKADTADRTIFISVDGNPVTRRDFLSRIREKFEEIHGTFTQKYVEDNITQKVPIPSNPNLVADYMHLRKLEDAGIEYWIPEGMIKEVSVKELLNGIETKQERIEDVIINKHIGLQQKQALIQIKTKELENINEDFSEFEQIKNNLDKESKKTIKIYLITSFIGLTLVVLLWIFLILFIGWDVMEKWTYIVGVLLALVSYGYFAFTTEQLLPWKFYEFALEKEKRRNYKLIGFDEIKQVKRKEKIIELTSEIERLAKK